MDAIGIIVLAVVPIYFEGEIKKMMIETQDFYLCCFLMLNSLRPTELRDFDNRKMFVFEDTPKFQQLKSEYYSNNAKVNPLAFKQVIRDLKALTANKL